MGPIRFTPTLLALTVILPLLLFCHFVFATEVCFSFAVSETLLPPVSIFDVLSQHSSPGLCGLFASVARFLVCHSILHIGGFRS